jgi:hypothetical protein
MPKLKKYLLPRIKEMIRQEKGGPDDTLGMVDINPEPTEQQYSKCELDGILFKNNCIYSHKIVRINFTTYDVRRSQDVIHTGTTHCNIMALSSQRSSESHSGQSKVPFPFIYGHVLGIYHVNVVYNGPGMLDYQPRRIEFLWIRWYEPVESAPLPWRKMKLDRIRFPPVDSDDAFGFLDPSDVVRTCHVIPRLTSGKASERDSRKVCHKQSKIAKSVSDYNMYYVNR